MSRATAFPRVRRAVYVLVAVLILSTSILAQSGPPTFGAPAVFDIGAGHASIALGDFDRDGTVDVVAASPDTRAVDVFLGNASGFDAPINHPLAGRSSAVALADIDRD